MKKLALVLAVLTVLFSASTSEAFFFHHHLFHNHRAHFQLNGPIQVPIPGFAPFFPGGNLVLNQAGQQPSDSGSVAVDGQTFKNLSDRYDKAKEVKAKLFGAFPAGKLPPTGKKGEDE